MAVNKATNATTKNAAQLQLKSARALKSKPEATSGQPHNKHLKPARASMPNEISTYNQQPSNNTESQIVPFSFASILSCVDSALFPVTTAEDFQATTGDAQLAVRDEVRDEAAIVLQKREKKAALQAAKAKKAAAQAKKAKRAKNCDAKQEAANSKIKLHEEARLAIYTRYKQAVNRADKAKKVAEMKDKKVADATHQLTKLQVSMKVADMEAKWAKKHAKKEAKEAERAWKKTTRQAKVAVKEAAHWKEAEETHLLAAKNAGHWHCDDSVVSSVETVLSEDDEIEIDLHTDAEDMGALLTEMMEEASLLLQ